MKTMKIITARILFFALFAMSLAFLSSCNKEDGPEPKEDPQVMEAIGQAIGYYDYEARYYVWSPDNESFVSLGRENYEEGLFEVRLEKNGQMNLYEEDELLIETTNVQLKNGGFTFSIPIQTWSDPEEELEVEGMEYYTDFGEEAQGLYMDVFDYVNFAVTTEVDGYKMLILTQGIKRD